MPNSEALAIITSMVLISAAVLMLARMMLQHIRFHRMARLQADAVSKVLDKLGSSPETLEWLRSGDMKRFFDLQTEHSSAYTRILNALLAGTVLLMLGVGFLSIVAFDDDEVWKMTGVLLGSLGIGFLISAAISYVLSKQWGLFEQRGRE